MKEYRCGKIFGWENIHMRQSAIVLNAHGPHQRFSSSRYGHHWIVYQSTWYPSIKVQDCNVKIIAAAKFLGEKLSFTNYFNHTYVRCNCFKSSNDIRHIFRGFSLDFFAALIRFLYVLIRAPMPAMVGSGRRFPAGGTITFSSSSHAFTIALAASLISILSEERVAFRSISMLFLIPSPVIPT